MLPKAWLPVLCAGCRVRTLGNWVSSLPTHRPASPLPPVASVVMVPSPISPATPSFLGVAKWGERRPRPPGAMMKPRARVLSSRKSLEVGRIWFLAHSVIFCPPPLPASTGLTGPGMGSNSGWWRPEACVPVRAWVSCLGGFRLSYSGFPRHRPPASEYRQV